MTRIMLLILLISANCMKMKCDEEPSTTETESEAEKPELRQADPEPLESKADNEESKNEASTASEDGEEIRISRSSYNHDTTIETPFDDSSAMHSTEVSFTEKSNPDEVIDEINKQAGREANDSNVEIKYVEAKQEDTKSAENVEEQVEELPETSRSAPETEDKAAKDLLEASAESKLNDNENASFKLDEIDRSFESKKIKEKSDESEIDASLSTRRMLSGLDNIIIDTKARADTSSIKVEPEATIAYNQNLNTYNNYNEFGTESISKLIDPSRADLTSSPLQTTTPVIVAKVAAQDIFENQYLPKFYPRPELNINYPNINSDFHGPYDIPIYLKVKQDDIMSKNHFIGPNNLQFQSTGPNNSQFQSTGPNNLQFQSTDKNAYYHPINKQQYRQRTSTNKQLEDLRVDTRNQIPLFHRYRVPINFQSFLDNKQLPNLNQNSINHVNQQQLYRNQEIINSDHKRFENFNREPRNQMKGIVNSHIPLDNKDQSNQYPLFPQPQELMESKTTLANKHFGADRFTKPYPYSYIQSSISQGVDSLNAPTGLYNDGTISKKIQLLFQKLASASAHPTNLLNNIKLQNYPYYIYPNYRPDSYFLRPQQNVGFSHLT